MEQIYETEHVVKQKVLLADIMTEEPQATCFKIPILFLLLVLRL